MKSLAERKKEKEDKLVKEQYENQGVEVEIGKEKKSLKTQMIFLFAGLLILGGFVLLGCIYKDELLPALNYAKECLKNVNPKMFRIVC